MQVATAQSVERKIRRLSREVTEIDDFFYGVNAAGDRELHAGMLERKRDDLVRGAVLQLHTAVEDVLTSHIICRVLGASPETRLRRMKTVPGRALRKLLFGAESIGFDMKLNLAVALGVINNPTQKQLAELNTLRNKCGHNWLLKATVRHAKRPKQLKPPLLQFRGNDLHNVATLKAFAGEYGPLYARLFERYISD